jgi:hypothetical protein
VRLEDARSCRYHVTGVQKTVVNGTTEIRGALPKDAVVQQIVAPAVTSRDA